MEKIKLNYKDKSSTEYTIYKSNHHIHLQFYGNKKDIKKVLKTLILTA